MLLQPGPGLPGRHQPGEGHADLTCQFCDKVYHFSKEELEDLLASATKD